MAWNRTKALPSDKTRALFSGIQLGSNDRRFLRYMKMNILCSGIHHLDSASRGCLDICTVASLENQTTSCDLEHHGTHVIRHKGYMVCPKCFNERELTSVKFEHLEAYTTMAIAMLEHDKSYDRDDASSVYSRSTTLGSSDDACSHPEPRSYPVARSDR